MPTLSPEEARQALKDVDSISRQTRLAVQSSVVSSILMLWGTLWVVIFTSGYLNFPHGDRIAWTLNGIGFVSTAILVARQNRQIRTEADRTFRLQLGALWAVLLVYALVLPFLLVPSWTARLALMLSIIMLGYVLQGIWIRDRLFVFLGFFITLVILACHAWLNPRQFLLGLGILGGGALFTGGLVIRLRWK
jgi:hypothetical protein